jgi:RNA polymerase sigma-32 factor
MAIMSTSYVSALTPELRQSLRKGDLLTREREYELVRDWQQNRNERALRELVSAHTRLVGSMIRRIRSQQLSQQDLFQEGLIGLVEAANRFDPERGFRFSTYALFWIKAKTREHVLRNWSIVRLPLDTTLMGLSTGPEPEGYAEKPSEDPVERVMERRRTGGGPRRQGPRADLSLNAKVSGDSETDFMDTLISTDDVEAQVLDRLDGERLTISVKAAIATLPDRERYILTERLLRDPPMRLTTIADHFGVTRERIRQLEVRGMKMLRERLAAEAVGFAHTV